MGGVRGYGSSRDHACATLAPNVPRMESRGHRQGLGSSMQPGSFPSLLALTKASKPALRAQRDPPSPRGGRAPRQSAPGRRARAAFRRCPRGPGRGAAGGQQVVGGPGRAGPPQAPPSQAEQWAEDARRPLTPHLPREPGKRDGAAEVSPRGLPAKGGRRTRPQEGGERSLRGRGQGSCLGSVVRCSTGPALEPRRPETCPVRLEA